MEVPLQITYHGIEPSEALRRLIRKETDKLEGFFDRIVSCHVRIDREQRHVGHGGPFRVRIDLALPGSELNIDTARTAGAAATDPALTVREAFRRARRRVADHARRAAI